MRGPAEAEEAVGLGVRIQVQSLDLVDTGGDQAVNDIGLEVEVRLARRAGHEEAAVIVVGVEETGAECVVHLVGGLGDARADRGVDVIAAGAHALHRLDGRVGDAGECAAPSGVGCAYNHRFVIGEQDGRTVGGEDPEQEVGRLGDHGIGAGARILRPWRIGNHNLGGMDLVNRGELGVGEQRRNG